MKYFLVLMAIGVLNNALEAEGNMVFNYQETNSKGVVTSDSSYKNALSSYQAFIRSKKQSDADSQMEFLNQKPLTIAYLISPLHKDNFNPWRIAVGAPPSKK